MRCVDEIKAMHLRELYRRMGWLSGVAVRDTYLRLSPAQHANIAQYAHQLRQHMDQLGDAPVNPVLLEMACLIPGAMRSKPLFMADQSPQIRPLFASERHEAREWLLQATDMAATLRNLTPAQWALLLPKADTNPHLVAPSETASNLVLAMLDGVLPIGADASTKFTNLDAALCAAYAELDQAAGRELAEIALGLWDVPLSGAADVAEAVLVRIACFVPDALTGLHYALARRAIFAYSGVLYKGADLQTSKLLIAWLDEDSVEKVDLNAALVALAWIGDQSVRAAFQRWSRESARWREQLYVSPADYAHEAGWELAASGERRDLVAELCYPLLPADQHQGPVRTITPSAETCGSCGHGLVVLLDLNLTDLRLAFLGIPGERLRVATCDGCCIYSDTYFTEIDLNGSIAWSSRNKEQGAEPPSSEPFYLGAARNLVLDSAPRGPLRSLACCEGGSQLGGYPNWVQDAEYPACPQCGQTMRFIGQLVTADFRGEPAEGITFCLVCPQYHTAATVYQQT